MTITAIPTDQWTPAAIDRALIVLSTTVARLRRPEVLVDDDFRAKAELAEQLEAHLDAHRSAATSEALRLCKDVQVLVRYHDAR